MSFLHLNFWQMIFISLPISFVILIYGIQSKLIYPADFPPGSREKVDTPDQYDLPYEDVDLTTADEVRLKAYFIKPKVNEIASKRPTLLYLHANAGNMGHRLPIAHRIYHDSNCNIFMLSYRGYGKSEGKPSETGIRIDAQTALDYLLDHPVSRDQKIILFGQSIGGAVAIDLASRNDANVAALIVENTFLSLPNLIPHVLPWLRPLTFLCHQVWPSHQSIQKIRKNLPILFLSSNKDEVIPSSQMKELYRLSLNLSRSDSKLDTAGKDEKPPTSSFRVWHELPNGTHNDAPLQPNYFTYLETFIRSL